MDARGRQVKHFMCLLRSCRQMKYFSFLTPTGFRRLLIHLPLMYRVFILNSRHSVYVSHLTHMIWFHLVKINQDSAIHFKCIFLALHVNKQMLQQRFIPFRFLVKLTGSTRWLNSVSIAIKDLDLKFNRRTYRRMWL